MRASTWSVTALCAALAGCATTSKGGKAAGSTPVPGWVTNVPVAEGKVYAIGRSGPTYWEQDALKFAGEDARGKLAIALQAQMEVLTKRADKTSGTTHVDIVKAATDLVLTNSRIEATWVDGSGVRGEPGAVFALSSIDVNAGKGSGKRRDVEGSRQSGVPHWLEKLPLQAGKLYAYGYSGPTYRTGEAVEYAGEDAVENLAKALRSHVQAYQLLVESNTGLSVDEFSRTESPDEEFRKLVKEKAKVETTWMDAKGIRPGYPAGSVWALAWIDVSSTKGGFSKVENEHTGPALTTTGEIGNKGDADRPQGSARPVTSPGPAPGVAAGQPAPAQTASPAQPAPLAQPASTVAPAAPSVSTQAPAAPASMPSPRKAAPSGKLAPYPSEGERCRPGYESTGGWCLPIE